MVHTLGAGSDASAPWLRIAILATAGPVLFLLCARVIGPAPRRRVPATERAR